MSRVPARISARDVAAGDVQDLVAVLDGDTADDAGALHVAPAGARSPFGAPLKVPPETFGSDFDALLGEQTPDQCGYEIDLSSEDEESSVRSFGIPNVSSRWHISARGNEFCGGQCRCQLLSKFGAAFWSPAGTDDIQAAIDAADARKRLRAERAANPSGGTADGNAADGMHGAAGSRCCPQWRKRSQVSCFFVCPSCRERIELIVTAGFAVQPSTPIGARICDFLFYKDVSSPSPMQMRY
eukprot:SAG31_NODE_2902_length_4931_cov_3.338369_2_plen_241_part_00